MVAKTKRALTFAKRMLALFAASVALFLLAAWIGSSVPRNGDWQEAENGVDIRIETNGIHTAIVMPIVTAHHDWRERFPIADVANPDRQYTHVSVSWGEENVFLHTPTWTDISPSTVVTAATGGDVMAHIAFYVRPAPSPGHRMMRLSARQYARLVTAVEKRTYPRAKLETAHRGYDVYDVFYAAPGTYHLGNTCNQFVSDSLAEAGVRTGWWTPLAGGVMKWVPEESP